MRSYRPEELFDERRRAAQRAGRARAARASGGWAPTRTPTAACCCATSSCRTSATTPSRSPRRRRRRARRRACSAAFLRDVIAANPQTLPDHGPRRDGLEPPRRGVRGDQPRAGRPRRSTTDDHLAPDGRVMEVLSEHLCQGWLEGYLLTGRHGLFNCYEAFIHIIDSMFNQHAKWLKVTRDIPWRRPIASLNYLLSSHVWRQDHNGFSHQDPGLHRPRRQQEGRDRPRLPAAGRQLPAVGRRPLPAQPRLRQRDRRRQAAGARLPDDRRGDRCTARAGSASGTGPPTTPAASPTSCSPAPATCRRSRRSPPPRSCASGCRSCGSGSSTSST